ncbi:MAG TPA: CoB--CoM heterodisulfide reductase iron-sulfur subunit A family protein [Candidatus Syntrophoarchaeum butanivorans]|uniref:CoB--CoM heterodisulfide reductase iron-sulfur subunit A n=1 Tax=Candidatus Syntropharchaeum butanivorans TaxID=1839936 RepID=A0A1F2P5P2_9EURY|nr:MAG: heterodisulfide reductase [Candidatus Syntrophoarchaeum butanivorans]HEC56994.1 CoB--CoM heterodisulfide reductase iron-sulfur subunit A family protein [Candidatus Syntrophoarchaeum butanivorans]
MKIGVFICGCDGEISDRIDLERLRGGVAHSPGVEHIEVDEHLCSKDAIKRMRSVIDSRSLDRIVIAGCSPRTHDDIFKGLAPIVEFANIREQSAWVHPDKEDATRVAFDLLRSAIARAKVLDITEPIRVPMTPACLVIGGGVAGMQAAEDLASYGFKVYLVERDERLGGRVKRLSMTFPTISCGFPCRHDCPECELTPKEEEVYASDLIEVLTSTEVVNAEGRIGDYRVTLKTPKGERVIEVGCVIIATGTRTFDPSRIPEYGYRYDDVITSIELEDLYMKQRFARGGSELRRPSDDTIPKRVDFIQCVGSRGEKGGNPYCSIVCCLYAIGHARAIKEMHPECEVYIHFTNIQAPYRGFEEYYKESESLGIRFVRGEVKLVDRDDEGLVITYEDLNRQEVLEERTDLVILSVGQEPSDGAKELANLFYRELDPDGFFTEVNQKIVREDATGVFIAGCALGPRNIRYAVADGKIAAENAAALLKRGFFEMEGILPIVDDTKCIGCNICGNLCYFGAIGVTEMTAEVIEGKCRGCGICAAACPEKAITLTRFSDDEIRAEIETFAEEVAG